jgi:transcriptional regulator with XRE-family HTH domain
MTTVAGKLLPVFRENVEMLLSHKGWSRLELAQEMGVTRSYVTQVLGVHRGVGLDAIEKFADALGVEPSDLIKKQKAKRRAS